MASVKTMWCLKKETNLQQLRKFIYLCGTVLECSGGEIILSYWMKNCCPKVPYRFCGGGSLCAESKIREDFKTWNSDGSKNQSSIIRLFCILNKERKTKEGISHCS